ncbi:MAG TPA: response regulator transcription factor [Ktedonobacterales bacterium]|nr:response regulator transcription factor [Ktedonobacterales bacterium]
MIPTAPTAQKRILVVDDESSIRDVLTRYLEREGYRVEVAADGPAALHATAHTAPDLIVLDLMLPGLDGLEVCHRLRAVSMVPIIMLTARDEEADKVRGFTTGADDYITKPFSPAELVLRIKAVLRRVEAAITPVQPQGDLLRFGNLTIAPAYRRVEIAGRAVDLSAREFDLLLYLASHPGQVFTRNQLLQQVWDYDYYGDSSTVTVHISRLREKLEPDPTHPSYIKTVWGVGYKFEPPA